MNRRNICSPASLPSQPLPPSTPAPCSAVATAALQPSGQTPTTGLPLLSHATREPSTAPVRVVLLPRPQAPQRLSPRLPPPPARPYRPLCRAHGPRRAQCLLIPRTPATSCTTRLRSLIASPFPSSCSWSPCARPRSDASFYIRHPFAINRPRGGLRASRPLQRGHSARRGRELHSCTPAHTPVG